jgi:hypothetical protein
MIELNIYKTDLLFPFLFDSYFFIDIFEINLNFKEELNNGLKSNDNLKNMFKNSFFNFLYKDI